MIQTEREAWEAVLDALIGDGMPWFDQHSRCIGLCVVVVAMYLDHVISARVEDKMLNRIEDELYRRDVRKFGAWGAAKVRIPVVRRFIEVSA
jgi:hypothetical protein